MTLHIERARSRRPITWLTLIGVLLLPVLIGGILVAALYNPAERLDSMSAAIVNEDEPVTIDDQYIPLGRQLTAGLVEGSDEIASNLDWTISNAEDAAAGLADGTYQAVVTIPANFSAAATSTAPGGTPEQATIEVTTPPDSKVVDDAITAQVTSAAASIMGQELSQVYLENVFLGFTTLGDQLGEAADGAAQLADGAAQAASGAAQLPAGIGQLGDGASQLSSGAGTLAGGLDTIGSGTAASANGANQLAAGLDAAAAQVNNQELVQAAQDAATYAGTAASQTVAVAQGAGGLALTLQGLADECLASGASQAFCDSLGAAAGTAGAVAGDAGAAATSAGYASGYATPTASGIQQLTSQTSAGLSEAAAQTRTLASGLAQLADGTVQSAEGARGLQSGASQLAGGATQAADGATSLADGVGELATGTATLADGLDQASAAVPSYTDADATSLATVVSDPVTTDGVGSSLFGASAVPLLSTLALWFGGLGTFVALQAASRRALTSRAPSALLALRGLVPAAVLGAVQGLLVAGVVQLAASYDWAQWSMFAALCVVAGIAFAAVNQALVAVFGGAGRWLAALVGVLAVATGVVSTVPGVLSEIAALLPTAPAYNGMLSALTETAGLGAGVAGLLIWSLLAFIATTLAVARRRVANARDLLAASPAPA
ncbi:MULTISPECIES: YhgE/Pip family protein [unclassified Microbacterium]|uniref:YhgE/Pip domain-containing protein n=1 Tax=unclassified Microbacterium TaxID=2609290 RepID=UPI00214C6658|nr:MULTISPECIES: YhgE/Pip family protein [unclassified Microbacterium]MCR2810831.1 YhgE/Pip family protein [Microbacterium sp. zg.B185]WIM19763.1 YhgE/Pip family protein [Microbacterium sp. zg-B185]